MADYIDREAVTKPLSDVCAECITDNENFDGFYADCNQCYVHDAIAGIAGIPAADVAPVVHGKWIGYPECLQYPNAFDDGDIVCSNCGESFNIFQNDTERFDYCPNCGADMRGGTK